MELAASSTKASVAALGLGLGFFSTLLDSRELIRVLLICGNERVEGKEESGARGRNVKIKRGDTRRGWSPTRRCQLATSWPRA